MISKTTSYTIVIFVSMLFVGAVFYIFAVIDPESNEKMSRSRLLPDAENREEAPSTAAPKVDEAPKPSEEPTSQPPVPRPVEPKKAEPTLQITETPESVPLPPKPEDEPESGGKTYIVSIETTGFNPKLVTITVGDTVRWINNNSKLHWPASDPHPTHTGLPDFDPFADLLPGESFSYTFKDVGAFSYHDHTQAVVEDVATLTGVIRVLGK